MARGVNKVILVGNTGDKPDVRAFPDGTPIMNFGLATSETWKEKNTGESKKRTEWHKVVVIGRLAEVLTPMIGKGSKLYVEGKLSTRKWQDKSGQDRYTTEVVARDIQLLDSAPGASAGHQQAHYQQSGYHQA